MGHALLTKEKVSSNVIELINSEVMKLTATAAEQIIDWNVNMYTTQDAML